MFIGQERLAHENFIEFDTRMNRMPDLAEPIDQKTLLLISLTPIAEFGGLFVCVVTLSKLRLFKAYFKYGNTNSRNKKHHKH